MSLSAAQKQRLNRACPALRDASLGTFLSNLASTPTMISQFVAGNLGHDAGVGSDGVLMGVVADANPTAVLLSTHSRDILAYADDGGAYTDETTEANEATGDDMNLVPATAVQEDAYYFGHATVQFGQIDLTISTQGNFVGTVTWEYWDGNQWTALANVTDGTANFAAATGTVSVTFDIPVDWTANTVDSVEANWVRGRLSAVTSGGGALATQAWIVAADDETAWTDDTADFTDADAGDVAALPARAVVGDGLYIGGETLPFWRLKTTVSQELTGTLTTQWQYWNGSAWTQLPTAKLEDASAGLTTGTSTYLVSFVPPSDWVACTAENGPDATAGYFIRYVITALTAYTQQPLITQGWIKGMDSGSGLAVPANCRVGRVQMIAQTASATNGDTALLLINLTQGTYRELTWTAADVMEVDEAAYLACDADDELALVQVAEDGSTEFADANIHFGLVEPAA